MEFNQYLRTNLAEGAELSGKEGAQNLMDSKVSISQADLDNGSPKQGDMLLRNPENHNDKWLVAEAYFKSNFKKFEPKLEKGATKTMTNTTVNQAKDQVSDLKVFGNGDMWQLLSKASSQNEGWMKSTKAMQIGTNCILQVTTQQGNNVAEAIIYVPNVSIKENFTEGVVTSRELVPYKN
jgi:hypothetical protein